MWQNWPAPYYGTAGPLLLFSTVNQCVGMCRIDTGDSSGSVLRIKGLVAYRRGVPVRLLSGRLWVQVPPGVLPETLLPWQLLLTPARAECGLRKRASSG